MKYTGSTPVFAVRDLKSALAHFRDVLDFAVDFEFGDPPSYGGVYRDEVTVHLQAASATERPPGASSLYVFVDDVDAVFRELRSRGAHILVEPGDRPYGLRDFAAADPDGNRLVFASDLPSSGGE